MELLKFILSKLAPLIFKLFGNATTKTPNSPEIETTTQTGDAAILDEAVIGKMILGNEG